MEDSLSSTQAYWQLRHAYYLQNRPLCRKYFKDYMLPVNVGIVEEIQKQTAITLFTLSDVHNAHSSQELRNFAKEDQSMEFLLRATHAIAKGRSLDFKEESDLYNLLEAIQEDELSTWMAFRIGCAFYVHREFSHAQTWLKKAGNQSDALAHLCMVYISLNQWDLALKTKLGLVNLPESEDDVGCAVCEILVTFNPKATSEQLEDAYQSVQELRDKYYPTPATSIWNKVLCAKLGKEYEIGGYDDEAAFEDDDEDPECPELKHCFLALNLINPANKDTWTNTFSDETDPVVKKYMAERRAALEETIKEVLTG
jgi:hypothetical protein